MNKRGLSPLIATVLIIGFTIVLASLLILWIRGINDEFMGGSLCDYQANLKCTRLDLQISRMGADNNNITLILSSNSDVDVNNLILQAFEDKVVVVSTSFEGSIDEPVIERLSGGIFSFEVDDVNDIDEIRVIPGLIFKENGESCEVYCNKIIEEVNF